MRHAAITGWGMSVPERVLTNADLERMVDTSDEWIVSRTGIRERRVVGPNDSTTSLAVAAGRQALARAGLTADEVDLIIVATCTPDQFLVSEACLVQGELGGRAGAFDLGAACAGFVYALSVGSAMIGAGVHQRVLLIGVDTLTRFVDYTDRSTCILFGDGAGAVVLEATDEPPLGRLLADDHRSGALRAGRSQLLGSRCEPLGCFRAHARAGRWLFRSTEHGHGLHRVHKTGCGFHDRCRV